MSKLCSLSVALLPSVLCLKYIEGGGNLQMWLEESGVIVEIVARAKEPDDAVAVGDENFGFDKSDLRARVIMISEYLKVKIATEEVYF